MKVTPVGKRFGRYEPGQEFELPAPVAKVFVQRGKLSYVTAALKADPEPVKVEPAPEISPRTGQPKRQYRRRDLTAEN